jgi:3-methylcrotonyl-CoA carboxylase alpha subunit
MIAKVIAHGETREQALDRLDEALARTEISLVGPKSARATNLGLLRRVLANPEFRSGEYDTHLLDRLPS